jgi:hypothetical protein
MDATITHNTSQLSQLEEYLSSISCRQGVDDEVTADSRSEHMAIKVKKVMSVPDSSGDKFGNRVGPLLSSSYSSFMVAATKSLLSYISALFLSSTSVFTRWILVDLRYLIRSLSKDKEYNNICCSDDDTSIGLIHNHNYYYIIRLLILILVCLFFIYKEIKCIFLFYYFKTPFDNATHCFVSLYRFIYISSMMLIIMPLFVSFISLLTLEHMYTKLKSYRKYLAICFQLLKTTHTFSTKISHFLQTSSKIQHLEALINAGNIKENSLKNKDFNLDSYAAGVNSKNCRVVLKDSVVLSLTKLASLLQKMAGNNHRVLDTSWDNKNIIEAFRVSDTRELKANSDVLLGEYVPELLSCHLFSKKKISSISTSSSLESITDDDTGGNNSIFTFSTFFSSLCHALSPFANLIHAIVDISELAALLDCEERRLNGCIKHFGLFFPISSANTTINIDGKTDFEANTHDVHQNIINQKEEDSIKMKLIELISIVNFQLISNVSEMREIVGCMYYNISLTEALLRQNILEINASDKVGSNGHESGNRKIPKNNEFIDTDACLKLFEALEMLANLSSIKVDEKTDSRASIMKKRQNNNNFTNYRDLKQKSTMIIKERLNENKRKCADSISFMFEKISSINAGDSIADLIDIILNQKKYYEFIRDNSESSTTNTTKTYDDINNGTIGCVGNSHNDNNSSENSNPRAIPIGESTNEGNIKDSGAEFIEDRNATQKLSDYRSGPLADFGSDCLNKSIVQVYSAMSNPMEARRHNSAFNAELVSKKSFSLPLLMELRTQVDKLKETFEELDVPSTGVGELSGIGGETRGKDKNEYQVQVSQDSDGSSPDSLEEEKLRKVKNIDANGNFPSRTGPANNAVLETTHDSNDIANLGSSVSTTCNLKLELFSSISRINRSKDVIIGSDSDE